MTAMGELYWNKIWDKKDIEVYRKYITGYAGLDNCMTRELMAHGCVDVCDGACGFGANAMTLLSKGFNVYGFDISENSVWLAAELLKDMGIKAEQFKVATFTDTGYGDDSFDAVTVRAALDHLSTADFALARKELQRILKPGGLLYASFDPLEKEDEGEAHIIMEDGSFLYTEGSREGLLFHYYTDGAIIQSFPDMEVIHFETDRRGNRHIILKNSKGE